MPHYRAEVLPNPDLDRRRRTERPPRRVARASGCLRPGRARAGARRRAGNPDGTREIGRRPGDSHRQKPPSLTQTRATLNQSLRSRHFPRLDACASRQGAVQRGPPSGGVPKGCPLWIPYRHIWAGGRERGTPSRASARKTPMRRERLVPPASYYFTPSLLSLQSDANPLRTTTRPAQNDPISTRLD